MPTTPAKEQAPSQNSVRSTRQVRRMCSRRGGRATPWMTIAANAAIGMFAKSAPTTTRRRTSTTVTSAVSGVRAPAWSSSTLSPRFPDTGIAPLNAAESRDQWTNVLGVSQTPTSTASLPAGTSLEVYGSDQVRLYRVSGMGHGTPVDPGSAADQCGTAGAYFLDTICSTYRDALFFGLNGGGGTPTPTPTATASPTPSPTPTTAPVCVTASNYAHVTAGRSRRLRGPAGPDGPC